MKILLMILLVAFVLGCFSSRTAEEYEFGKVVLVSVKKVDGQFELIWMDRHEVEYPVYLNDTTGMNFKIGMTIPQLIKR